MNLTWCSELLNYLKLSREYELVRILEICFTTVLFSLGLRGEEVETDVSNFFFVDGVNEDLSFIHTNRGQSPWANESELLQNQPDNRGGEENCAG